MVDPSILYKTSKYTILVSPSGEYYVVSPLGQTISLSLQECLFVDLLLGPNKPTPKVIEVKKEEITDINTKKKKR